MSNDSPSPDGPAYRADTDLHRHIAQRVRSLRDAQGLSLDALAQRSGVSRSMLSLIERAEASPTAVVLERLATALDVSLASLFDAPGSTAPVSPVARRADQALWRDPQSGYRRRNVSPPQWPSPIQIVEVQFPAGARVAYETGPRESRVHQQVWVLEGRIEVTVGPVRHELAAGDCLALLLDQPLAYVNPGPRPARYAVVLVSEPRIRR
jgi:transcriptional regulator with XRE-family HTH domain